jgi:hypothetical protein
VSAGESLTLTIQAVTAGAPGSTTNTGPLLSSTQILTRQFAITIYNTQLYLPVIIRHN